MRASGSSPGALIDALAEKLGELAERDAPLGARTTYRVGGNAALLVHVSSEADLERVHESLAELALATTGASLLDLNISEGGTCPGEALKLPVEVLVVGNGSNLLVSDAGFAGLAVAIGAGLSYSRVESGRLVAGAATLLPVLARRTAAAGLRGFEWAVGVPGSLGGAVRMNAGGHGSDMASVLRSCRVFDLCSGDARELDANELSLGYRTSSVMSHQVVVHGEVELVEGDAREAEALVAEVVRWRREHQPGGSNAGSVFVNPPGDAAGRLIEEAGLKGRRLGSARVSEKHANFIQADAGGSADDVYRLIELVREEVERKTGVDLVPEVRLAGFGGMNREDV